MSYTPIDLSLLTAPDVVETLDFETILAAMRTELLALDPSLEDVLALESDPIVMLLEVVAAREVHLRQRVNDAARAVMLAYATGNDLDQLAAFFGVERLIIDAGDPDASPPVPATYETDTALRQRVQLSLEALSVAGPIGAYEYHARSADGSVKDVDISSPVGGHVLITVLSTDGDGTPDQTLLDTVAAALSDEDVRPLTDSVSTAAATIHTYAVDATLYLYDGPDSEVVRQAAEDAVTDYVDEHHRLGHDIRLSGLYAALHQSGVQRVVLNAGGITADLVVAAQEAAYCTGVTVTVGGVDE